MLAKSWGLCREPGVGRLPLRKQKRAISVIRPVCSDFQEAAIETLAGVISSPKFLYLVQHDLSKRTRTCRLNHELATRSPCSSGPAYPTRNYGIWPAKEAEQPNRLARQRTVVGTPIRAFRQHFTRQWLYSCWTTWMSMKRSTENVPSEGGDAERVHRPIPRRRSPNRACSIFPCRLRHRQRATSPALRHTAVYGPDFLKSRPASRRCEGRALTQPGLLAMNR